MLLFENNQLQCHDYFPITSHTSTGTQQNRYLWGEEKAPHNFMAKAGSARSSSKISNEALVLNVASSCWAEVPLKKVTRKTFAFNQNTQKRKANFLASHSKVRNMNTKKRLHTISDVTSVTSDYKHTQLSLVLPTVNIPSTNEQKHYIWVVHSEALRIRVCVFV